MPNWIDFHEARQDPPMRTRVWLVYAKGGGQLGEVRWFGRWRCYAFFPYRDTVFERQCLRDLAAFCEKRTEEHRATWRASRARTQPTTGGA